jgi:membrane-associated protein
MVLFINIEQIIISFGYLSLFSIIFAETGLLLGFFLPGDTLLFTAGLLASKNIIGLPELIAICFFAAVIGDSFGYYLGKKYGKGIFEKKGHFLDEYLNKENLGKTQKLYEKYGGKIIFLARFIPVVRTIAPTMAGTAEMNYPTFLFYNLFGAITWVVSASLAGYFIGGFIPNAMEILETIILIIVVVSFLPIFIKYLSRKYLRN